MSVSSNNSKKKPGRPKVPSYVVKIMYTQMEAFVDKKGVPAGLQGVQQQIA